MRADAQLNLKQRWRIAKARAQRTLARTQRIEKANPHTDWMNECVPDLMDHGKDQDVAVAACLNIWRDAWEEAHPDGADDPGPDRPDEKRLREALARFKTFDPNQPRDEDGKWTSGGGGGSESKWASDPTSASSLMPKKPEVESADEIFDRVPKAWDQAIAAKAKLAQMKAPTDAAVSMGGHKLPDGSWTPERQALHLRIQDELMTDKQISAAMPKPGEKPVLYVLGGRGGSGKGWFTDKKRGGGIVDMETAVYINSDDVKDRIPEYAGWNAGDVHEESSYIGERMEIDALKYKLNTIVDVTMKSMGSAQKRIDAFKAAGYEIRGYYMHASPATAATRALERFVSGNARNGKGRYVPPEYSLGSLSNEHTFDELRSKMDHWEVYDNNGSAPKLHAKKG